jgi:1-acyl-sn-glycerol-3-phosphate acyltransferase
VSPLVAESARARWSRRAVTIPLAFVLLALLLAAAPVVLLALAIYDVALRRRLAAVRCYTALTVVAAMECIGLVWAFAIWVLRGGIPANFRLQCWWTSTLLAASQRVLGVRFELPPLPDVGTRPILLLVRHASLIDTLFPAVTVAIPHQIRLRYLLKHQLAWDPCIDVIGQRLENVFVRRGSKNASQELVLVQRVAEELGPKLGVVVFPEGTRYSPARRAAAIDKLRARGDTALLAQAEALQAVLPPQPGGVLALLQGAPEADVVFLAHTGLEEARTLADLWNGKLIGRVVRATSWRVPREQVPTGVRARIAWLYDEWAKVDAWVAAEQARGA